MTCRLPYRHLEQVTWATLVGATVRRAMPEQTWLEIMEQLSESSLRAYRDLVDQPGFMQFFSATTPIDEIEDLPIASRPARRRGERTLDDLRAIPWVFSWTQNRSLIPAWYGLGAALSELADAVRPTGKLLRPCTGVGRSSKPRSTTLRWPWSKPTCTSPGVMPP